MTFDPSKPVQTRDGRKATIYYISKSGRYPITARVFIPKTNREEDRTFSVEGFAFYDTRPSHYDLINITEEENENGQ